MIEDVGFRLKRLRQAYGLKQSDIAAKANIAQSTYAVIEARGSLTFAHFQQIALAYSLTLTEFIDVLENEKYYSPKDREKICELEKEVKELKQRLLNLDVNKLKDELINLDSKEHNRLKNL